MTMLLIYRLGSLLLILLVVVEQPSAAFLLRKASNNHAVANPTLMDRSRSMPAQSKRPPMSFRVRSTTRDKTEEENATTATVKSVDSTVLDSNKKNSDSEGLPWWWELVWKLDIMKTGEQGKEIIFGDSANVLRTNIEQIYGGYPSLDGCPLAEGEITDIGDGTMFIGLQNYFQSYGSPYKLCFGPKSFLVISDPIQARHLLRDANKNYDKVRWVKLVPLCYGQNSNGTKQKSRVGMAVTDLASVVSCFCYWRL
jgi:hypothetical protein